MSGQEGAGVGWPRWRPTRGALPFLGALGVLFVCVAAMGDSPAGLTAASGSFSPAPGDLPAGTAGGSELTTSGGGSQASLELWASPGLPTYFLDVVEFDVQATRATTVLLSAQVVPDLPSLPAGGALEVLLGTPASGTEAGGSLSSAPTPATSPLAAIVGLGGAEGGLPGLATGVQVNASGTLPLGDLNSVTLDFHGAGAYQLVLSVAVVLPLNGGPELGDLGFTVSITMSHPLAG